LNSIYQGTNDSTVPPRYSFQIEESITQKAHKKLVIVEGAGHDLTVSHPKEVLDALIALLSGSGWILR
jgi:pimeloyl-ACP methyl ester carboxylesterase